jgi:hypothetical protein
MKWKRRQLIYFLEVQEGNQLRAYAFNPLLIFKHYDDDPVCVYRYGYIQFQCVCVHVQYHYTACTCMYVLYTTRVHPEMVPR